MQPKGDDLMRIDECDGRILCVLDGHFDTLQSVQLEQTLKARLVTPMPVTFDMQAVTYVCSAFLRVCLLAAKTAGAGQFALRGVTPTIKRVFMMAGLAGLLAEDPAREEKTQP
jgi:anti-anti-sigma factor